MMKRAWIASFVATLSIFSFATSAWQAEWAEVVAAAKREGKVVVIGPQGTETREALTEGFQRKYPEIQVEHSGAAGAQLPPRLLAEQKSERYSVDLLVQGTTTVITGLMSVKAVIPIQPFLAGPNAQDASVWLNKKFNFADEAGQYNLVMSVYILPPFIYNPTMVSTKEIKAWKDLLASKWKGRLAARDPRLAGGGLAIATFWYANPKLGKEFIRQLFGSQDIAISRDDRQLLDFVGQRKYPIAIGPSEVLTKEWIGKGLPVRQFNPEALQEGALTTAGNGAISVPRNPPHPNALKVYIDYLLSKPGQTEWSKAIGFASLRQDVPRDHVAEYLIPKEGVQYLDSHLERYVNLRSEVVAFLNTVLPR
ncbi:MAG TPA: extracellular solute-binding protein [Candidatus Binatia bacterium]|jgi:iron(III) transport system substrate-binding protein